MSIVNCALTTSEDGINVQIIYFCLNIDNKPNSLFGIINEIRSIALSVKK